MDAQNEWLVNQHSKNFEKDQLTFFLKFVEPLLRLYKLNHSVRLARFICQKEQQYNSDTHQRWISNPYQSTLLSHLKIIERELKRSNLPEPLHNIKIKDVRCFDSFNAESFPCFGDNLIAINSGVFFHSHTLVRAIQTLICKELKPSFLLKKLFYRKYQRASTALICNDHTKAFSMISFISENDDLLYGIEIFTIAHEYAHLMFKVYDYDQFHFKEYFDTEFDKLIKSNEEIAADAVPLLILYNYTCKTVNKQLTLYSPEFLFKNLSNSEASELLCKPRSHPSHIKRYQYIKK